MNALLPFFGPSLYVFRTCWQFVILPWILFSSNLFFWFFSKFAFSLPTAEHPTLL
jgi:hypothetical protein